MRYENATGGYQNDFLEKILGTDFRYDVPYKIDRKKYDVVLGIYAKNGQHRIEDADVVVFSCEVYGEDFAEYQEWFEHPEKLNWTFFAWPENSPNGSNDYYDVFTFHPFSGDVFADAKQKYDEFVRMVLGCIVGVDKKGLEEVMRNKMEEYNTLAGNIAVLENLKKMAI